MAGVVIASGDCSWQCSCFIVPKGSQRVLFGQDIISELDLIAQAHVVNTTHNPVSSSVKGDVSISVKGDVYSVAKPWQSLHADFPSVSGMKLKKN